MKTPSRFLFLALLSGAAVSAAELPPGRFIDLDSTNTAAAGLDSGLFFTDDASSPGFLSGSLWRRRAGFGFDIAGNRDVYEKDANGGFGDAVALVTTVRDLRPGTRVAVHVAFLSVPEESWRIRSGFALDQLQLFRPGRPEGRVLELGLSSEPGSNRRQYLGYVGDAVVGPEGELRLYTDDGEGFDWAGKDRSWIDGYLVCELAPPAPVIVAPVATPVVVPPAAAPVPEAAPAPVTPVQSVVVSTNAAAPSAEKPAAGLETERKRHPFRR